VTRIVRVATYNVHGCRGRDRRRDVARVARVLHDIDADIIGLQEVESRHGRSEVDQAERLAAALGMAYVEGPLLRAEQGWYGNALLTRFEVRAVRRVRFEEFGREARGAVICDLVAGDLTWRVMTTHLDLHSRHRRRQFEALLDELVPAARQPTVLLGDFNEWWPSSRALAALRRHTDLPAAPPSFPSWLPILRLDRVALSACRLKGEVCRHLTPLSRRASDHLPIFADVVADAVTQAPRLETSAGALPADLPR
jgi:endonuclease/exonuclease/phosphatase family metal-dependent hydrolase